MLFLFFFFKVLGCKFAISGVLIDPDCSRLNSGVISVTAKELPCNYESAVSVVSLITSHAANLILKFRFLTHVAELNGKCYKLNKNKQKTSLFSSLMLIGD